MKIVVAVAALVLSYCAGAMEIEDEHIGAPKVTIENGVYVIESRSGAAYTVAEIPAAMISPKLFSDVPPEFNKPKYLTLIHGLSLGEEITHDDVVAALDAYVHEVAFEYESVKIRNLEIRDRKYLAWCDNWMFTCLSWQFRAGTWVQFEMNAKNRVGGMTGYEQHVLMMRKLKASDGHAETSHSQADDSNPTQKSTAEP